MLEEFFHRRNKLFICCRYFLLGFCSSDAGVYTKLISTWIFFPCCIHYFYLDVGYNNLIDFILVAKILPDCFISIKSSFLCYCLPAVRYENTWSHSWRFFFIPSLWICKKLRFYIVRGIPNLLNYFKMELQTRMYKTGRAFSWNCGTGQKVHWWMCVWLFLQFGFMTLKRGGGRF